MATRMAEYKGIWKVVDQHGPRWIGGQLGWGPRGLRFESGRSDHSFQGLGAGSKTRVLIFGPASATGPDGPGPLAAQGPGGAMSQAKPKHQQEADEGAHDQPLRPVQQAVLLGQSPTLGDRSEHG